MQLTQSTRRKTSTLVLSLSAMLLLSGCAKSTKLVCENPQVPQTLLQEELPLVNEWHQSFLRLLSNAEKDGNGAQLEKTP